MKRLEDDAIGI